jgi:hypothetical protein
MDNRELENMGERHLVVLYGNSLVLAGMGTSLKAFPDIDVIELGDPSDDTIRELCALQATVVLFDLAVLPPDFLLSLLQEKPKSLLIGLDAAGDRLLLLSGQQAHSLTTGRLLQVIETLSQRTFVAATAENRAPDPQLPTDAATENDPPTQPTG